MPLIAAIEAGTDIVQHPQCTEDSTLEFVPIKKVPIIASSPTIPKRVKTELNHVSLKLRQILGSVILYAQHPPDLRGPNVQKLKVGVRTRAGWAMTVNVAFLIPRQRHRVINA